MEPVFTDVTDTELAVLQVLWAQGPATIRRIADAIYPRGTDARHATVQKLLERLESKGHVARDRSSHAHVLTAATSLDTLVSRRLRAMAEKLCSGKIGLLLTHLLRANSLTVEECSQLRLLINKFVREKRRSE